MNSIRAISALAVVIAVVCAACAPVAAQGATQPAVGVVDVQKAFNEYKVTTTSNEEINRMVESFRRELDIRASHRLLTEEEVKQLVQLRSKSPLTDADRSRIDELERISKQRDEELNALSNKSDLTEQERARLKELRDLANRNDANGRTLAEDYSQQVEQRKSQLSDKITADLKEAIAKVAQAKGLATVVDKIAVLYGGVDITEDVIKTLNSG
ncbi:MAG: OmpH family outer membrane protein [Armatimonadota bacterium]